MSYIFWHSYIHKTLTANRWHSTLSVILIRSLYLSLLFNSLSVHHPIITCATFTSSFLKFRKKKKKQTNSKGCTKAKCTQTNFYHFFQFRVWFRAQLAESHDKLQTNKGAYQRPCVWAGKPYQRSCMCEQYLPQIAALTIMGLPYWFVPIFTR